MNVLRTHNLRPVLGCQEILIQDILDSITFHVPIHRPFLILNNNKRFLNQNQIKALTNSINETSTHFCFR